MNIFVLNAGSSSVKYQLFKLPSDKPVCSGLVERIGLRDGIITHKSYLEEEKVVRIEKDIPDHEAGLLEVVRLLTEPGIGVIRDPSEIEAVGHRVVHGGESFSETVFITQQVKEEIRKLFALAPLHNPGNLSGIEVAEKVFSKAKQLAVFDTAFHQTLPEKAFRYAIPPEFYIRDRIRVYGFHGTSHKYVSEKAAEYLHNPFAKIITVHLGNGCSMAAVKAGKCIETSMGFTPLQGLIMGTRSGEIDPSVLIYLMNEKKYTAPDLDKLLNKKSGMLGMTGHSDMRDIRKQLEAGSQPAILAYEMYCYRIKKYIGAYSAALNGLDAVVFTAGVGENDALTREMVCEDMEFFGIVLDKDRNTSGQKGIREINSEVSKTKVLVIPTNEEYEIALQCFEVLKR